MIKLTELKARGTAAGDWREERGIIASLHHEVGPGLFVHVTLGAAGLMVFHGEAKVGFPLEELLRLAQEHEKDLVPVVTEAPVSTVKMPGNVNAKVARMLSGQAKACTTSGEK